MKLSKRIRKSFKQLKRILFYTYVVLYPCCGVVLIAAALHSSGWHLIANGILWSLLAHFLISMAWMAIADGRSGTGMEGHL